MASSTCPEDQLLVDFIAGKLPEELARIHEPHLAVCSRCVERAEELSASDTKSDDALTDSLRGVSDSHAFLSQDDSDAIERLIKSLSLVDGATPRIPVSGDELRRVLGEPLRDGDLGSLSRYRIVDVIGAGGMGVVFRGIDPVIERSVAIKVLRPSLGSDRGAVRRFRREACAMAAVAHPYVATILEVGEANGLPFFTMPWLEGQSLKRRMQQGERLERSELLRIASQIASGLAAAHRVSVLHRDIKPDNVWICDDEGEVRILDFGLARGLDANSAVSQSDALLGTPSYMAPEQIRGEKIDERVDLFALGCLLYHAAAGEAPFGGPHAIATLIRVAQDEPQSLEELRPDLGSDFGSLVRELMSKRPEDRPSSAQRVLERLKLMSAQPSSLITTVSESRSSSRFRAMLPWLIALGFAAGFLFQIVQVVTDRGTLVIEADDQVAVEVQNEQVTLRDQTTGKVYVLRVGENPLPSGLYEIQFANPDSGLEFSSREFAITRGSREPIRVSLRPSDEGEQAAASVSDASESSALTPSESFRGWMESLLSVIDKTTDREDLPPEIESTNPTVESVDSSSTNDRSNWSREHSLVPAAFQGEEGNRWTIESVAPRGLVTNMKFSADGTRLATTGADGIVRLWDVESQSLIACISVTVADFAWSPDNKYLAMTETQNNSPARLAIWEVSAEPKRFSEFEVEGYFVRWSQQGLLAVAGREQCSFVRLDGGDVPASISLSRFDLGDNVFSREGDWLVIPDQAGVRLHHLKSPEMTFVILSRAVRPSFLPGTDLVALAEVETVGSPNGETVQEQSLKLYGLDGNLVSRVPLWNKVLLVPQQAQITATGLADGKSVLMQFGNELALVRLNESHERVVWHEFGKLEGSSFNLQQLVSTSGSAALSSTDSLFAINQGDRIEVRRLLRGAAENSTPESEPSDIAWTIELDFEFPSFEHIKSLSEQTTAQVVTYSDSPFSGYRTQWWNLETLECIEPLSDEVDSTWWDPTKTRRLLLTSIDDGSDSAPSARGYSQKWKLRIKAVGFLDNATIVEREIELPSPGSLLPIWSPDGRRLALIPTQGTGGSRGGINNYLLVLDAESGAELHTHSFSVPDARRDVFVIGGPIVSPLPLACWSPNGRYLAWLDHWSDAKIFDCEKREVVASLGSSRSESSVSGSGRSTSGSMSGRTRRAGASQLGIFWSPLGDRLLFVSQGPGSFRDVEAELWNTTEIGSEPSRVVKLNDLDLPAYDNESVSVLGVIPDWGHERLAVVRNKNVMICDLVHSSDEVSISTADGVGAGWLRDGRLVYVEESDDAKWTLCALDPVTRESKSVSIGRFHQASLRVHRATNSVYLCTNVGLYEFDADLNWKQTWWMSNGVLDRIGPSLEASRFGGDENRYRVIHETASGQETLSLTQWREREK